jgi:hypothetical protein
MTHTNHRRGDRGSLEEDYVLFTRIASEFTPAQKELLKPGFKTALEICARYDPVCLSTDLSDDKTIRERLRYIRGWEEGNSVEEILALENPKRYCSAVFDNRESMERALTEIKEADMGHSVIVSAIFDDVFDVCANLGVGPHTANMSMGTLGRTDLLPEPEVLEITTMCGHAFVSRYLVEHLIDKVRNGKLTPEEVGVELSKQCICGYANPVRAANIISEYVGGMN